MADFHRTERINDLVRAELSDLVRRKMKDPRAATVSITSVSVSPDLSHAAIAVSVLSPADERPALAGLRRAAGFLRGELGRRLHLKKTPELTFEVDRSVEASNRLEQLLDTLSEERDA